jgi:hypothetical protein
VGDWVGLFVGDCVGGGDGPTKGANVGANVNALDGLAVGFSVAKIWAETGVNFGALDKDCVDSRVEEPATGAADGLAYN